MTTLALLQNAWSPTPRKVWPRRAWLRALHASRTGRRLEVLFGEGYPGVYFDNTTPRIGTSSGDVLPPDPEHVCRLLLGRRPGVCVALGAQAEAVLCRHWNGPLLALPHPCYRLLTNALLEEGRRLLSSPFRCRLALRQRQGHFVAVPL